MGDGRTEGSSAIRDGGQAAISLTPDADGTHMPIFESSQLEGLYVGDLPYMCRQTKTKRPPTLPTMLPGFTPSHISLPTWKEKPFPSLSCVSNPNKPKKAIIKNKV